MEDHDSVCIVGPADNGYHWVYGKYEQAGEPVNGHLAYMSTFAIADGLPSPLWLAYGPGSGSQGRWWLCDAGCMPSDTRAGGFMRSTNSPISADEIEGFDKAGVHILMGGDSPPAVDYTKFVDAVFPPDPSSLGAPGVYTGELPECWLRSNELVPSSGGLFDDIGPDDLLQGSIGNCWLLAAIAAVAEFPQLIESLFLEDERSSDGRYHVRFYSAEAADWQLVEIDNYTPSKWNMGVEPQACFANAPPGGEEWPMLLEKAVAKFCGSYGACEGGSGAWALMLLLGPESGEVDVYFREDSSGHAWSRHVLSAQKLRERGVTRRPDKATVCKPSTCKPSTCGATTCQGTTCQGTTCQGTTCQGTTCQGTGGGDGDGDDDERTLEAMWSVLTDGSIEENIFTTGGVEQRADSTSGIGHSAGESVRGDGLVEGHCYSLLRAYEDAKTGTRLVQLRNPWGTDAEWTGPWGDHSSLWQNYPHIAAAVDFVDEDDGTFWMSLADWASNFSTLTACSTASAFAKADDPVTPGSFAASRAGRGKGRKVYGRLRQKGERTKGERGRQIVQHSAPRVEVQTVQATVKRSGFFDISRHPGHYSALDKNPRAAQSPMEPPHSASTPTAKTSPAKTSQAKTSQAKTSLGVFPKSSGYFPRLGLPLPPRCRSTTL